MRVRTFSDDVTPAGGGADKSEGPEYSFEGYNVEFSTKVLLTPLVPNRSPLATGQSISNAFILSPKKENQDELTRAEFDRIDRDEDRREAINRILQTAAGSAIARVSFARGRGIPPVGYVKGMAIVYAMVYCKLQAGDPAAIEMAKANTGDSDHDALAFLAPEFNAAGMANDVAGADTLRHVFVLLFGLGMLESSGQHCVGADSTAIPPPVPETAEAGLFQLSFNARHGSPLMPQLFQHYQANPAGFLKIFQEGVSCDAANLANLGAGDAKEFQRLSKACPAFAAEFAAVGLRNIRQQWGPINRREPEIRSECDAMLLDIQSIVDAANLCPLVPT